MGKVFDFNEGVKQRNAKYAENLIKVVSEDIGVYTYAKIKFIVDTIVFDSDIWTEDVEVYDLSIEHLKLKCLLAFNESESYRPLGTFEFFHALDAHIEKYVTEAMKDFEKFMQTEPES